MRAITTLTNEDVLEATRLINSTGLPMSRFIPSTKFEVLNFVKEGKSIVCKEDNKIIGVMLIKEEKNERQTTCFRHIDTIVSTVKGVGTEMINSLPKGFYTTFISPFNKTSLSLFGKFKFIKMVDTIIDEQIRGMYLGKLGYDEEN